MTKHTTSKLSFWQRRFVERHYRQASDRQLARHLRVSERSIADYLEQAGGTRSQGDARRIASGRGDALPDFQTPADLLRRATAVRLRPLDRRDHLLVLALFVASLVLYGLTAARTVTGEDAGELLAAAHELGVPHPPGYPLWTLLGHAFDHGIPFGTVAWRVSMVSGVFAAAANALLLAVALRCLSSRIAAVAAAALFAVSLTHWSQAVIPEVYGLSTFFVAWSLWAFQGYAAAPTGPRLIGLAAICGLACTNHTTAFVMALILALSAFAVAPSLFVRWRVVLGSLVAAVVPLALYLLLPVFSAADPYVDWGNPESQEALWAHVTRAQYAAGETGVSEELGGEYLIRLSIVVDSGLSQFGAALIVLLALPGFVYLLRWQTGLALVATALAWSCSIGITRYTQFSLDVEHVYANTIFFIPAWFALALFIGGGFDVLMRAVTRWSGSRSIPGWAAPAAAGALALVATARAVVVHGPVVDRSDTTIVADYARELLDSMGRGALYFPASDHTTFAVMFLQAVENHRTDVRIADKYGYLDRDLVDNVLDDEARQSIARRVQAGGEVRRAVEDALAAAWPGPVYFAAQRPMDGLSPQTLLPIGPGFKVASPEERGAWIEASSAVDAWDALLTRLDVDRLASHPDITVQMIRGDVLFAFGLAQYERGDREGALATWGALECPGAPLKQLMNNVASTLADGGDAAYAVDYYRRALDEDPRYATALRNLAMVYRSLGQIDEAEATLRDLLLARDVDPVDVRLQLARLLAADGRIEDALRECEIAALAHRRRHEPWEIGAEILDGAGDLAKAEESLERAVELAALEQRGALLAQLEDVRMRRQTPRGPASAAPPIGPEMHDLADPRPSSGSGMQAVEHALPVVPRPARPATPSLAPQRAPRLPNSNTTHDTLNSTDRGRRGP